MKVLIVIHHKKKEFELQNEQVRDPFYFVHKYYLIEIIPFLKLYHL